MRRWSARGQVEPLAALAAVFAVCVGLTVYAGAATDLLGGTDRDVAETVLDRTAREAGPAGFVTMEDLKNVDPAPPGWQANVTLRTPRERTTLGPSPPDETQRARRQVAVRVGPGQLNPGTLVVEVWK